MTKRGKLLLKEVSQLMANKTTKKKQLIRNNEYYDIQETFDNLYSKAKKNKSFNNLFEIIVSEQNIMLAYRNIKKNKGSKTCGTNKTNIINIGKSEPQKLVAYVRQRLGNFKPNSVKRVEIPKENGKTRPLGIPTIEDRLIQQCIKQVLEPICEAKFHKHSYGFRPNRSTHHAIARTMYLTNRQHYQYVIDLDIKGFFDNVNHGKLLKQMWTMGIRDKKLLCIVSKMLKAEIFGIGIPEKGVPQGGILSPLLANIVLNEFDWWISSQWETIITTHQYKADCDRNRKLIKHTKLKQVYFCRYADDIRLFCIDRKTAVKIYCATEKWLKERLGLEISPEKSKIVNLKKNYSEFLGIKFKLWKKKSNYVIKSHLTDKSKSKCKSKLTDRIKGMAKETNPQTVMAYNAAVMGIQNYYQVATNVNLDFRKIAFHIRKTLHNRLDNCKSDKGKISRTYNKFYGKYNGKITYVCGIALYPVYGVITKPPMCFTQQICNYTETGRAYIHNNLKIADRNILQYIMKYPLQNETAELNDNRISLYVGQNGKCFVTGEPLQISDIQVHHKKSRKDGGTDNYDNLVLVTEYVHILIHAKTEETLKILLSNPKCKKVNFDKLNKLRVLVGNSKIDINK